MVRLAVLRDEMPLLRRAMWCLCLLAGVVGAMAWPGHAWAGEMYWCPGNRFTDALSPAEAKARGCRLAASGRLSQVSPPALPPPATEGVAATGAGEGAPVAGAAVALASPAGAPPGQPSATPSPAPISSGSSAAPVAAAGVSGPARVAAAVAPAAAQAAPLAQVAAPLQTARDRDARLILEAELNRTLVAQQSLVSPAGVADPTRLHRLRQDEAALRREIARLAP